MTEHPLRRVTKGLGVQLGKTVSAGGYVGSKLGGMIGCIVVSLCILPIGVALFIVFVPFLMTPAKWWRIGNSE